MSWPRWRCASKISAPACSSRRSSASHWSISASARPCASTWPILDRVPLVPDVVIHADTFRSPELRNVVPIGIPDPFTYLEIGGVQHIAIGAMEIPRLAELGSYVLHPYEEFGSADLIAAAMSYAELRREVPVRAIE